MSSLYKFKKGDRTIKKAGYRFPGVIVSRFCTTSGKPRYVVECTASGARGCLHIFSGDQLELDLEAMDDGL